MSDWKLRLVPVVIMGLFILILINESRRETPFTRRLDHLYIQPFIDAQLNGVVVKVRSKSLDLENFVYARNANEFVCQDLLTDQLSRYEVRVDEPIQVGDTIRKSSGQNSFLLFCPNGEFYRSHAIRTR